MNRLFLMGVAGLGLLLAGPASAADLPVKAPPAKTLPFASRFTWTGCYGGAHAGGAWEQKDVTDPVRLVQDNVNLGMPGNTLGTTTTRVNPSGAVVGGQIGCDYQFTPSLVLGIEAAASGTTMKATTVVPLQPGVAMPGDVANVYARTDFITTVTGRLGYAVDHWMFYGKGGVGWASDKYSVTGTFNGNAFNFQGLNLRTGWTLGAGVEWAFTDDWSARLEYDYYDFGTEHVRVVDMANGPGDLNIKQAVQMVKLGVNFHFRDLQ